MSLTPDSFDTYATHSPSGENSGANSIARVATSAFGCLSPSSCSVQMSEDPLAVAWVYASTPARDTEPGNWAADPANAGSLGATAGTADATGNSGSPCPVP